MPNEIREADWKVFRELKPAALGRYCERVLTEVAALIADAGKSHHERYLAVFEVIRRRDRELAAAFDGLSRSTALHQLALMRSQGLLTDDELSRFSPDTREALDRFAALARE